MILKKSIAFMLAVITAALTLFSCAAGDDSTPCDYYLEREDELRERELAHVTIEVEEYGEIKLALDATAAPITVRHFLKLAGDGFYNGLSFHRISEVYAMGGDPNADGSGYAEDAEENIITAEGEFLANGYKGNDIKHKRGVISMLRFSNYYDSASSQFFICTEDISDLDGQYAAFGYVTDGMDVVDAIVEQTAELADYYGFLAKENQPKIKSVKIDDLGGIDPDEKLTIQRSDACEYTDTRSLDGREVVYADITVKDYGTVRVLLDKTTAPVTVANFVKLANEGFYNGLTFHRVMSGFMIQGGCPDANGTGGYKDADGNKLTIKGEFSSNGHENDISHLRGVISMARGDDKDSASSQFFICNADSTFLDGNYAAFGYVVSGLRVVDAITRDTAIYGDSNGGISSKTNQAVIESIVVVSAD